jgi:hypothetical protein
MSAFAAPARNAAPNEGAQASVTAAKARTIRTEFLLSNSLL